MSDKQSNDHYTDEGLERYMAMAWGSPNGIAILLLSLSATLLSVGAFLWMLHIAKIIN
jgi:hypothetical protein